MQGPLRPGHPPGHPPGHRARRRHEIDEILRRCHWLRERDSPEYFVIDGLNPPHIPGARQGREPGSSRAQASIPGSVPGKNEGAQIPLRHIKSPSRRAMRQGVRRILP